MNKSGGLKNCRIRGIMRKCAMDANLQYAFWSGIWDWVITVIDVSKIEKAAAAGADIDSELCNPDMWLYLALRELYRQHRVGLIDRDQAKKKKAALLARHELERFYHDSYLDVVKMRNRIESQLVELEKCGCEHCKRLIRIFDGRDRDAINM